MTDSGSSRRARSVILIGALLLYAPSAIGGGCEMIYRLNEQASYQEGCFPPCACPIQIGERFRGTFVMGPPSSSAGEIVREVERLLWIVELDGSEREITGSGTYRFTGGPPPQRHALDLDLSIDGGVPQRFSSGFVPREANHGSIEIAVSLDGQQCWDTVIVVGASPVPAGAVLEYRLAEDSTYQRGCFPPCECPIELPRRLEGTLSLTPILDHGTYEEYAAPRARFEAPPPTAGACEISLTGYGMYTLIQGFAGPIHALDLRLRSNGGELERFDNSLLNTEPTFPDEFAVEIDTNDQTCYDTVLSIHAVRSRSLIFENGFECGDVVAWLPPAP